MTSPQAPRGKSAAQGYTVRPDSAPSLQWGSPPQWAPMGAVPPQAGPVPPPVPVPQKPKRSHGKLVALGLLVLGLLAACVMTGGQAGSTSSGSGAGPAAAPAKPAELAPAKAVTAREWQLIAKDPKGHAGQRIVVYGQVVQFDATTGTRGFRANVDGIEHKPEYGYADYDTNTILHSDDEAMLAQVVQDDLFKAEVTVAGAKSYETVMGGTMTAPELTVTKIETIGHV
jgi:hypothetical protein